MKPATAGSSCAGFVSSALVEEQTNNQCWIEAGYRARSGMDGSEYFWADARPGYKYADHPEGLMTMLDQGKNLWVLIQKESASAYYVQLDSLNGPFFYDGNSSPNDREADNIYEGLEVSGGGGASAPRADFTQNQWFDPLNKEHYEPTAQGTYFPIFSTQRVGATANSTGGDWWTSCCKP